VRVQKKKLRSRRKIKRSNWSVLKKDERELLAPFVF
jgi:hypothetical protein